MTIKNKPSISNLRIKRVNAGFPMANWDRAIVSESGIELGSYLIRDYPNKGVVRMSTDGKGIKFASQEEAVVYLKKAKLIESQIGKRIAA